MSIHFTPTAGTVTTYTYYTVDADDRIEPYDDVKHGILRFDQTEPSVQACNSNGLWLLKQHELYDGEDCYTGEWSAEGIAELLELNLKAFQAASSNYETTKLGEFRRMLMHCQYHQCGFNWG